MPATTYFKTLVLDHAIRGVPFVVDQWTVGLFLADPTVSGSMANEVNAVDYERQSVTWNTSNANAAQINWPVTPNNWGSVTYVGICDTVARGTGNMYVYQVRAALSVTANHYVYIPVGGLTLSLV